MVAETTILNVIEETLGQRLSGEGRPSLERLNDQDLKRLGRALYEFSEAEWLDLPTFDGGQPCFAIHPNSHLTYSLGGTGWGAGLQIPFSPEHMTGTAMLALTYLPRVAVNDGIQYFLDYYDYTWDPTPKRRDTILNILQFYGSCGDLIRNGELVIVPRSIWLDIRTTDLSRVSSISDLIAQSLDRSDTKRDSLEEYRVATDIKDLVAFCSASGYGPLLDTSLRQVAFDALCQHFAWGGEKPRGASPIQRSHVMLPAFSKLKVTDFIQARKDQSFAEFRQAIDEIGRLAGQASDPYDLKELIIQHLEKGKARVQQSMSNSAALSGALKEARDVGIGVVGGYAVAGAVNPGWADDPWKLLTVGGTSGLLKLSHGLAKHLNSLAKNRRVCSLFVSMLDSSTTRNDGR